jgi:hypothetical protein
MVTHYESLQEGAVDGTPIWGIFLSSVQQPIRPCCPRQPQFGFFPLVFEVATCTMVTHYESLQEGAVDGTPLWGIFLASVQQPIRPLLSNVAAIWFFSSRF